MNTAFKPLGLALMSGVILATSLPGQPDQEELKARREEKLACEFLTKANWITNYDKARAEAKKSKKVIFAYFTRSYSP
ncbi:MAG: hypothetical protein ACYTGW_19105 [Planctomycetota bacterium]